MAREQKQNVFMGDSFPATIECRKTDIDDPRNNLGLPDEPIMATASVLNKFDEVFLPLGGPGVFSVAATITPATGITKADRGALVQYTVAASFTQLPGDFVLFLKMLYDDGAIVTEDIRYKVLEFR